MRRLCLPLLPYRIFCRYWGCFGIADDDVVVIIIDDVIYLWINVCITECLQLHFAIGVVVKYVIVFFCWLVNAMIAACVSTYYYVYGNDCNNSSDCNGNVLFIELGLVCNNIVRKFADGVTDIIHGILYNYDIIYNLRCLL